MDHELIIRGWYRRKAQRAELKKAYEELDAELKADMEDIEFDLHGSLLDNKVKSMATDAAVFYLETVIKPSCKDWEAYWAWMIKNRALDGLEKRVSKGFIADFLEANDGELPPGIDIYKEQVVRIRAK